MYFFNFEKKTKKYFLKFYFKIRLKGTFLFFEKVPCRYFFINILFDGNLNDFFYLNLKSYSNTYFKQLVPFWKVFFFLI